MNYIYARNTQSNVYVHMATSIRQKCVRIVSKVNWKYTISHSTRTTSRLTASSFAVAFSSTHVLRALIFEPSMWCYVAWINVSQQPYSLTAQPRSVFCRMENMHSEYVLIIFSLIFWGRCRSRGRCLCSILIRRHSSLFSLTMTYINGRNIFVSCACACRRHVLSSK